MEKSSEQQSFKNHFTGDLVIGMSDGLTVPFALAAGLSGAVDNNNTIVMAGIAAIVAGSIAMGLGGYYSGRSETDHPTHEHKNENEKNHHQHDEGLDETKKFFANLGLSESLQEQATGEVLKDKDKWNAIKMKYDSGLLDKDPGRAARTGWIIGLGYVAGGLLSLAPYFFPGDPLTSLKYSAIISLTCLFFSGWINGQLTGTRPLWTALRLMLTGAAAAAAAFGVAKIFEAA